MKQILFYIKRGIFGIMIALTIHSTLLLIQIIPYDTVEISSQSYIISYLLHGAFGFSFCFFTILFTLDRLNLLQQYLLHMLSTIPFLILAYHFQLMENSIEGAVSWLGIYFINYGISFILYLNHLRKQAQLINQKL